MLQTLDDVASRPTTLTQDSGSHCLGVLQNLNWENVARAVINDLANACRTLQSFGIDVNALYPLRKLANCGEPYGRKILFASAEFEVMLATWESNVPCAPHDHGHSSGAVWLAQGEFIEQHYTLTDELNALKAPVEYKQGSLLLVTSGDIHSMHAPKGGMTLHFYSPAVHQMKIFDSITQSTLTLADDCGAWMPSNPEKIVSQKEWTHS